MPPPSSGGFEPNHQGIGNVIIEPMLAPENTDGKVQRSARVRGLLNYYERTPRDAAVVVAP